ncbi:MAG: PH domain-containing protein [Candidatus Nomurabacteria bacterium]|jgi:hypothetical protein|nr:PH domain-containing protein [Candidatus Nomurabacteria bacterium]
MNDRKRQRLHKQSEKRYADLGLENDEFVVTDVGRHPLGRLRVWAAIILIVALFLFAAWFFAIEMPDFTEVNFFLAIICVVVAFITPLAGIVAVRDYDNDWMVVTNLRLIQNIRHTVFASENQEIGLDGIEDISFRQTDPLQKIFNYGSLRLSTIGDEHTYIFTYVSNPAEQVKLIRKTVTEYHEKRVHGKS